jgi:hypothetical protein
MGPWANINGRPLNLRLFRSSVVRPSNETSGLKTALRGCAGGSKHVAFLIETAHAAGQYTTVMRDVLLAIAIVYVVVECPGVSRPVSLCIAKLARFLTMPLS